MVQNMSLRAILRDKVLKQAADLGDKVGEMESTLDDLRYVRDTLMREENLDALIKRLEWAGNRLQWAPNYKVRVKDLKHELSQIQDDEALATAKEQAAAGSEVGAMHFEDPDMAIPSLVKLLDALPPEKGRYVDKMENLSRRLERALDNVKGNKERQAEEILALKKQVDKLRFELGWPAVYPDLKKGFICGGVTPGHGGKSWVGNKERADAERDANDGLRSDGGDR